jgi:hypothetical protein
MVYHSRKNNYKATRQLSGTYFSVPGTNEHSLIIDQEKKALLITFEVLVNKWTAKDDMLQLCIYNMVSYISLCAKHLKIYICIQHKCIYKTLNNLNVQNRKQKIKKIGSQTFEVRKCRKTHEDK